MNRFLSSLTQVLRPVATLLACAFVFAGSARSQTVDAFDSGWYGDSVPHSPSNTNYLVGYSSNVFRSNFAAFHIPTFSGPLLSASIRYYNPSTINEGYNGYNGSGSSTFEVFGLGGINLSLLLSGGLNYLDLTPSAGYLGSTTVSPSSNGTWVTVDLSSSDALNLLTAHAGADLAFGGSLASESSYLFGFSQVNYRAPQLVLVQGQLPPVTPVPEPSTYGLMGAAGLFGLAALRRRMRRKTS